MDENILKMAGAIIVMFEAVLRLILALLIAGLLLVAYIAIREMARQKIKDRQERKGKTK